MITQTYKHIVPFTIHLTFLNNYKIQVKNLYNGMNVIKYKKLNYTINYIINSQ